MSGDSEKVGLDRLSLSHESSRDHSIEKESVVTDAVPPGPVQDGIQPRPTTAKDDIDMAQLEKHLSRKSTRKTKMEPEIYPLMDMEKGLVGWDSQDDPTNPRNFTEGRKWFIMGLIAAITFLSPFASSIFAPALPFVNKDFNNTSDILGSFSISIFVLGFAVGPLFLSPLSEIFGRRIVLNCSNVVMCGFSLGCALAPNMSALLVMRLLSGVGGSACLTVGAGVISDLFQPEQRGKAMSMYSAGILWGPVIGPIMGGFIAQRVGWRWDFYVLFIAAVVLSVAIMVLAPETNPVVLMEWKAAKLRKDAENEGRELKNVYTHEKPASELTRRNILLHGLVRPLKLLFTSPIVFLLSLYVSFVFGLLYLLFTTVTEVYITVYHWSPELSGLAYLGIGIGAMAGIIVVAKTSDATIIRLSKRNNGVYEPEFRLPLVVFFGLLIPISFFWYGWTAHYHVHWAVPIIGFLPFGFGMMGILAPIQTYLIDTYPMYAASAVAGLTTIRCIFGALLPLAGPAMFDSLGLGWGNSLLGFIAAAMIPFPVLIYKYGGYVRKRWPVEL